MRTTVDIDQDLLDRVRKQADRAGVSFREELNRVIHRGLRPAALAARERYVVPTFDMGVLPGVNLDKALALAAAMEDEEIIRKIERRK